jgi:hypothetical protein
MNQVDFRANRSPFSWEEFWKFSLKVQDPLFFV